MNFGIRIDYFSRCVRKRNIYENKRCLEGKSQSTENISDKARLLQSIKQKLQVFL